MWIRDNYAEHTKLINELIGPANLDQFQNCSIVSNIKSSANLTLSASFRPKKLNICLRSSALMI